MRQCAICDDEFDPKGTSRKFCSKLHKKICLGCGNEFTVKNNHRFEATRSCSPSCRSKLSHTPKSREKREENSLKKYGTKRPQQSDEVKKKTLETNRERYGADHPNQNAAVRAKGYATNREKFGVSHPLQNKEIRDKAAETLRKNFGVTHPSLSPTLRKRAEDSLEAKYGVRHSWQANEVKEKIKEFYVTNHGVEYPSQVPEFREKALQTYAEGINTGRNKPYGKVSKKNLAIKKLIEENFQGSTVTLEKHFGLQSFDLCIEDSKILIEINPTASHNNEVSYTCLIKGCESDCVSHPTIARDYHYRRALVAQEAGYRLIQIYDWDSEASLMKLLSGKLGKNFNKYSSRKLESRSIPQKKANEFLTQYHVQGGAKSQSHCYGLFNGEELLAVATFGEARFKAKADYEWVRYAVKADTVIHGGANKLWRMFVEEAKPESVISYVDFDHTTAKNVFLAQCGFVEDSPTGPALLWSKADKRVYNNSLLTLGADRLLGTKYGSVEESGMNNNEIMVHEGWLPVYTAGNRVFRWSKD